MEREAVVSSNVQSVGYDPDSAVLEVAFHSGDVYQYYDVPAQVYIAFRNAESKGKYHARNIKGKYRYEKKW